MTLSAPNAFVAYTVIMLAHGDQYLLLHRAAGKQFMPGKWTGVGGLVELQEFDDLRASVYRELWEETGITSDMVTNFALRRALLHMRPAGSLTLLLYYSGELPARVTPSCTEGDLRWVTREQMAALDVIDTTRPVLPLLADDIRRDPRGVEPVRLGVATHLADSVRLAWLEAYPG